MTYQFLSQTIDMRSSKLVDELVTKDILSSDERKKIKEQRKTDAKVNSLMMMLKKKSAAQFESLLTTLSETGQQSIADAVRRALHTVARSEQNPLQYAYGKRTSCQSQTLLERSHKTL